MYYYNDLWTLSLGWSISTPELKSHTGGTTSPQFAIVAHSNSSDLVFWEFLGSLATRLVGPQLPPKRYSWSWPVLQGFKLLAYLEVQVAKESGPKSHNTYEPITSPEPPSKAHNCRPEAIHGRTKEAVVDDAEDRHLQEIL